VFRCTVAQDALKKTRVATLAGERSVKLRWRTQAHEEEDCCEYI
jgi:hypothetical protein